MFVEELKRLAAADPRVGAVADRAAEPLRVAVTGRRGVGRGTVARALSRAGVAVISGSGADVVVHVVAEVMKPQDVAAAAAPQPVLVVWNKADLAEARSGIPMVALLAVADLDDELWAALRALADGPPLRGGVDDVGAGPYRVPRRLRDALDLPGITLAVETLRRGGDPAAVRAVLHDASGVDAVCTRIVAAGAEARYRRILRCVAELEAVAVDDDGGPLAGFLSGDAVLAARASAAAEVLDAAGFPTEAAGRQADQLRAAVTWRRYSRAPVSSVYQACADDLLRVSLRRWSARGER